MPVLNVFVQKVIMAIEIEVEAPVLQLRCRLFWQCPTEGFVKVANRPSQKNFTCVILTCCQFSAGRYRQYHADLYVVWCTDDINMDELCPWFPALEPLSSATHISWQ